MYLLFQRGADPNISNYKGKTALMDASCNSEVDKACLLLENGANIHAKDENGWTSFIWAMHGQYWARNTPCTDIMRVLVKYGADVNTQAKDGSTALIIASNNGRTNHVQMLLENYKVDVNIKNKYGKSALMGASNKGHLDTVRVLLEHGYSLTHLTLLTHSSNLTYSLRACSNAQAKDGKTSLMFACYRGKIDVVRLLLEKGADQSIRAKDGATPLLWATSGNRSDILQLLLENGGNINVQDENGETALIKAAIKGNQDAKLIRLLLENGADPYIKDNKGRNAISVAKTPIIKKIIKRLSNWKRRKALMMVLAQSGYLVRLPSRTYPSTAAASLPRPRTYPSTAAASLPRSRTYPSPAAASPSTDRVFGSLELVKQIVSYL